VFNPCTEASLVNSGSRALWPLAAEHDALGERDNPLL